MKFLATALPLSRKGCATRPALGTPRQVSRVHTLSLLSSPLYTRVRCRESRLYHYCSLGTTRQVSRVHTLHSTGEPKKKGNRVPGSELHRYSNCCGRFGEGAFWRRSERRQFFRLIQISFFSTPSFNGPGASLISEGFFKALVRPSVTLYRDSTFTGSDDSRCKRN